MHSNQYQLLHSPLLFKIWDLSDRKQIGEEYKDQILGQMVNSYLLFQWMHFATLVVQFWPHLDLSSLREWGRCVWKYKADPEYKALTVIQTPCRLFASTTNPPFRTIRCNATVFCWTIWFHSLPVHNRVHQQSLNIGEVYSVRTAV